MNKLKIHHALVIMSCPSCGFECIVGDGKRR